MSESHMKKLERDKLPWYYRLVLNTPGANFLENVSSGLFWAIIVPVFLVLFSVMNLLLIIFVPFPASIILLSAISVAIFLVFVRINLERFINSWNSTAENSGFKWDIERTMQEYLALQKKKDK